VAALERDLHVLCEVPAARSVEESRELARAVEGSEGTYMLAENDVFRREWMVVAELVADGRFGDVYYARGEREEIRSLVQDQAMQAHGRAVLEDFDEKRIHGRARLSVSDTSYELLFVSYHEEDGEARWTIEAFVEEDGAWYRTDVLLGNPRFQVVRAALRSGEITARG
jgi:hypothetical protein